MKTYDKCVLTLAYVHQGDGDILGEIARAILMADGYPEHPGDFGDELRSWVAYLDEHKAD